MKTNTIIIALLMIILSTSIYSQIIKDFGIKIGLTSSNITISDVKSREFGSIALVRNYPRDQLISPTIGVWARILDYKFMNLEVESSYIIKGLSHSQIFNFYYPDNPSIPDKKQEVTTSWTVKYLQLTLNSQFKLDIDNITAYGIIGPTASYLIKSETFVTFDDSTTNFIFGYNFGIGVDISQLIDKNIFCEVKYNGDFTEFYKNDAKFWNKVWIFSIGVKL